MKYLENFIGYLTYEKNYSTHTVKAYCKDIEQFFSSSCFSNKECSLNLLSVNQVRGWMVSLMDQGYEATSVKRKLSSLRVFSRYLYKVGDLESDQLSLVEGPKIGHKLPELVRSKDLDKRLDGDLFTDDFLGQRDRLIIEMFYSTGIRLSELIGLDDGDVDIDSSQLKVLGKGNKERVIPFGETLSLRIQKYIEVRNSEVKRQDEALFVRDNGLRVYPSLVYKVVKNNLSVISSLVKCSPHVLRHSFATNMLNNGADLQVIKEILGHTSLSATEVYTHTTFKELKKVYNQAHPRA